MARKDPEAVLGHQGARYVGVGHEEEEVSLEARAVLLDQRECVIASIYEKDAAAEASRDLRAEVDEGLGCGAVGPGLGQHHSAAAKAGGECRLVGIPVRDDGVEPAQPDRAHEVEAAHQHDGGAGRIEAIEV